MLIELFLLFLVLYLLWKVNEKPDNIPPGYWGIPFLGYIPLFGKGIDGHLDELNNKHGDVVSWRLGSKLIVVLFDFKLLKTAFLGQDLVDRADIRIFQTIKSEESSGIVSGNGMSWLNGRRFALRHLRDLGMGKSRFVANIQEEATELVKEMKKTAGKPGPVGQTVNVATVNVIWQMVASKRYKMHDKEVEEFEHMFKEMEHNMGFMVIQDFFPSLRYIIPKFILDRFTMENHRQMLSDKMTAFLLKYIDEHKASLDPNNPRDYIDAYLIEMEKQKDDPESTMTKNDLTATIADFFGAGSETTTTTIKWSIYYLINNPEVQTRLQKEIDDVLPDGAMATMEDKPRLPYTEAFIHEVLRYSTLAKFIGIHMAIKDTSIAGYNIPKGTYVVGALHKFHYDSKYYENPNEFRPERFLDSEGKFSNPKDGFAPFGTGRRQCLGESLARMELFVFLTSLVQTFHFSAPPPATKVNTKPLDVPFMNFPRPDSVLMTIR